MNLSLQRLRQRWQCALRFAGTAKGLMDWLPLLLAGIARHRPFAGSSLYARVGRGLAREVSPRLAPAKGRRLHLNLREQTDLMVFEEVFIDGIYPLERISFDPDLIIDCGACAGFFSVFAHARFPGAPFHLFEPHPKNLERIQRNLDLNTLPFTVHAAAVGTQEGRARFEGSGFGGHLSPEETDDTFEVKVIDLAAYLRKFPCERLLLKIDIEGAEVDLLPTLLPGVPRTTALFLETHQASTVWQAYLQPWLDAGFAHQVIRRRHDEVDDTEYTEHLLLRP